MEKAIKEEKFEKAAIIDGGKRGITTAGAGSRGSSQSKAEDKEEDRKRQRDAQIISRLTSRGRTESP